LGKIKILHPKSIRSPTAMIPDLPSFELMHALLETAVKAKMLTVVLPTEKCLAVS